MDNFENLECSVDINHEFNSSDEYHEFQCSTCKKEAKNVGADMYCVECDHFLCQACLKQHNKFGSLKTHQLTKTFSYSGNLGQGDDRSLDLPSQRCPMHHGKLIDMFCQKHNEVCCVACAATEHSSCSDMLYLPKVAKEVDVMKETKDILVEIEKIKDLAKNTSDKKRQLSVNLKAQKSNLCEQIKIRSDKIINHFKTLETDILSQLEEKVGAVENDLQSDLQGSEEVISALREENQLLSRHIAGDNISSLFVQLKLAEKCRQKCVDTLKSIKSSTKHVIELSVNTQATEVVDKVKSLGTIVENKTVKTTSLIGEFDVSGRNEKNICDITDIIQHNDGTFYMTDFENRNFKRFDSQYQVTDCLILPGQPSAACFVCSSSVAIALTDTKRVQFASLTDKMTLTSSFSVRDHCRGIAHVKGNIYVTCGGFHKYGEGKSALSVYSLLGKMLYVLDIDLSLPKHVLKHRERVYIADAHCLVILTDGGRKQQRRVFKEIANLKTICTGPGNQHFICGLNSNNIILLTENAYPICSLEVNGIEKPQALCFDHQRSQLTVAMESSRAIKVFQIEFE